ncbi:MAG: MarR family winged helix-turn-helix transcriptional regulator [Nocardioidaceae bacterium]
MSALPAADTDRREPLEGAKRGGAQSDQQSPAAERNAAQAGRDSSAAAELGADLLRVVARLHRWATRHADLSLPPGLARLLAQIEELEPSRIGDLAKADHCSQPTMTTQVQRLKALGLVSRTSDPDDGRAVLITLTGAGRAQLADLRTARAAVVAPLVDALDADDRGQLRAALAVLSRLIDDEVAGPMRVDGRTRRLQPHPPPPPKPPMSARAE